MTPLPFPGTAFKNAKKPDARVYRVRRSHPDDHEALGCGATKIAISLTIDRIDGARMIIAEPRVGPFCPWRDTDEWAGAVWREYERCGREALAELRREMRR